MLLGPSAPDEGWGENLTLTPTLCKPFTWSRGRESGRREEEQEAGLILGGCTQLCVRNLRGHPATAASLPRTIFQLSAPVDSSHPPAVLLPGCEKAICIQPAGLRQIEVACCLILETPFILRGCYAEGPQNGFVLIWPQQAEFQICGASALQGE